MSRLPFTTIAGSPQHNGLSYCTAAPLPPAEADLLAASGLNPAGEPAINLGGGVALRYENSLVATVVFNVVLPISSNTSYVILQGDLSNGSWFDLAGCVFSGTTVNQPTTFLLPCGPFGTLAVLQQTRKAGTPPPANFFNPSPPPGRFRFVGQGVSGGSGSGAAVVVSIVFRPVPVR